ncbi:MAG: GntR family transcriptional regulator [Verrucomicrobia bacterium]|nr:GntR family transcriptional regulator [Verrucomicrobiota bacterium]
MQIQINPQDGTPLYQQIVDQVKYMVASGRLGPGDEIPTIRALAEQLTINPNTVARAYMELDRSGIVYKRQGTGTFVGEVRSTLSQREKLKILAKRADALLVEALHLGIGFDAVVDLLKERGQVLQSQSAK